MIFFELFITFFKIGLFTFGGGYAMLPLIQEEVLAHGWVTETEVVNFIAVAESTPGPFAINMSTYVGSILGGQALGVIGSVLGAACATLGVVLPSFIIILIIARCYEAFKKNKIVKGAMSGLKPAVIGLIGAAVLTIAQSALFVADSSGAIVYDFTSYAFFCAIGIFAVMAVLAFKKVHPILLIVMSAVAGIGLGYLGEVI